MPKRIKSGYINSPEKILIHSDQDRTGSYPTIARTGDHDFSGKSASTFDDTDTIVFASGTANVMYPVMLRTGSKYMTNDILNTGYWSGILAPGAVMPGVSDNKVRLGSGQSISPFDESRLYLDNDAQFYATGTSSGTLPGFDQRLSSKVSITIDTTPTKTADIFWSTGTLVDATSFSAGVSSGISYFSWENKEWQPFGDLTTGSNVDYLNQRYQVASGSYLAICPSTQPEDATTNLATEKGFGLPISTMGFPFASKFEATGSQLLHMTSSLTAPFLLEKVVFEFSGTISGPCLQEVLGNPTEPVVQTFVIMRESQAPTTGTHTVDNYIFDRVPDPNVIHSGTNTFVTSKHREIVWFGRAAAFGTNDFSTVDDLKSEFPRVYQTADLWAGGGAQISDYPTGTHRIEAPVRVATQAPFFSPLITARNTFPSSGQAGEDYFVGNSVGGASLKDITNGRSFIKAVSGDKEAGTFTISPLEYAKYTNYFEEAPFVLLPTDKIIFAAIHQIAPRVQATAGGEEHSTAARDRLVIAPAPSKITLYGSLLRNNLPVEPTTNQPLTSLSVHEDLHYDNPVYDQWDVESYAVLTGSYVDLLITGSMFAASSDSTFGDPFAAGARQIVASVAAGQAGDRSSLARFVRFRDPFETLLDSFPPDAGEVATAMGAGAATLGSGEAALLAPFIAVGSPDLSFSSRGWINEWYTMTAYEVVQDRKKVSGRITTNVLDVYNASDTLMGTSKVPIKEVAITSDTGYASSTRFITDGSGLRRTPNAQRNGKKALWGFGRNKNTAPDFADDHATGYTPVIRGYKYGLVAVDGFHPSVVFRRDQYGQFRDMLEQRLDYSVYGAENEVVRPIDIKFVPQDSVAGGTTSPSNTHSQNLSNFATASIPYHDGLTRDRSDNPDTSLEPIDINILGNLL